MPQTKFVFDDDNEETAHLPRGGHRGDPAGPTGRGCGAAPAPGARSRPRPRRSAPIATEFSAARTAWDRWMMILACVVLVVFGVMLYLRPTPPGVGGRGGGRGARDRNGGRRGGRDRAGGCGGPRPGGCVRVSGCCMRRTQYELPGLDGRMRLLLALHGRGARGARGRCAGSGVPPAKSASCHRYEPGWQRSRSALLRLAHLFQVPEHLAESDAGPSPEMSPRAPSAVAGMGQARLGAPGRRPDFPPAISHVRGQAGEERRGRAPSPSTSTRSPRASPGWRTG